VVAIPRGFDRLATVRAVAGGAELIAENGRTSRTALDLAFVQPS